MGATCAGRNAPTQEQSKANVWGIGGAKGLPALLSQDEDDLWFNLCFRVLNMDQTSARLYLRPHPWLLPLPYHASLTCSQVLPEEHTLSESRAPESPPQALLLGSLTHDSAFVQWTHSSTIPAALCVRLPYFPLCSLLPPSSHLVIPETLLLSGLVYYYNTFELVKL